MPRSITVKLSRLTSVICVASLLAAIFSFSFASRPVAAGGIPEVVFSNTAPITINSSPPPPRAATPYPSDITVSGLSGTTTKVTVTINNLSHTQVGDVDMLLVSPTNSKHVFMSDTINNPVTNVTVTLDDAASSLLPLSSFPFTGGTFRPTDYNPVETFAPPAPAPPYGNSPPAGAVTLATAFNGVDPNGTWSLYINDDTSINSGSVAGGWSLNITTTGSSVTTFSNSGGITINDVTTTSVGATPYPSAITVSGLSGVVTDVNVTLNGVTHPRANDIDVLLVSPNGLFAMLLSDVPFNGDTSATNANVTFDDSAPTQVPVTGPLVTGTYRATDVNSPDTFPAPAPQPGISPNTFLSVFNGVSPNGDWNLYVVDDSEAQSGTMTGGWSIDITTAPFVPPILGCGSASFAGPTNFNTGNGPTGSVAAQLNGDSNIDLVTTDQIANTVSVMLGNGLGGFGAPTAFGVGASPYAVTTGLFNADSNVDLAVANSGSNNISILLGNGSGGFSAPTNFTVGPTPISVAVGDFNNDTNADLAVAEFGAFFAGSVSILLGTGTGSFGPASSFPARTQPAFVAVGDFTADSNKDLAVANFGSNNVSILQGTGTGTFAQAPVVSVGLGPVAIKVADFNVDGKSDLAVANYNGDTVSIRQGTGLGTFLIASTLSVGPAPISIGAADFSGDSRLDLAIANRGDNTVSVALGSTGGFNAALAFGVGGSPSSLVVADFNNNGQPDIATTNTDVDNVSILLNGCAVAKGSNRFDWDGDRRTDFAVFRPSNNIWYILNSSSNNTAFNSFNLGTPTDILVPEDYTGDGKDDGGYFRPSTATWVVPGVYSLQFGLTGDIPVPADYDGDGRADIAVFRPSDGTWYTRRTIDNMWTTTPFGTSGDKPIPRDFDGDGKADIAVFRPSTGTWYILNSSNSQVVTVPFGASGDRAVAADYDGDGKADVAVFRPSQGTWYSLRSIDGGFVATGWGESTDIPAPGDYDSDGRFDIAVFRPGNGFWYVLRSSSNTLQAVKWGVTGDVPIPSTNVPTP